jgi:8-oxo-dGTP pyrophosphatase MutT (NUDIX family)
MAVKWEVVSERSLYRDQWLDVRTADVALPDGRRLDHRLIRMSPSAGAVVVDAGRQVLLIWRHRFITGQWGWEIPMGMIDPGEDPATAAAREVAEETGWQIRNLRPLLTAQPTPGILNAPHRIFLASEATQMGEPADRFESSRIGWVPLADVPGLIAAEQIVSYATMASLLLVLAGPAPAGPAPAGPGAG